MKVQDLEEKVLKIVDDAEKKEKQERKNNIIFTGRMDTELKGDQVRLKNYLQEKCRKLTNTNVELQEICYIATNRKGMDIFRTRVNNFDIKMKIMKNKFKLTEIDKNFYIDDDLTKTEADIQKQLREMAAIERKKNNRVKVGYRKL